MAVDKASLNEKEMMSSEKKEVHLAEITADVDFIEMLGADRAKKEKELVRKVDIRMMPLMMVICGVLQALFLLSTLKPCRYSELP